MLVPELLRIAVKDAADRIAVHLDGGGEMTYEEWDLRSNAGGRGLAKMGLDAGDRVALWFDSYDWIEYSVAYMSVLKAGGVAVPLSFRWSGREVADVIEHSGASAIIAQPEYADAAVSLSAELKWIEVGIRRFEEGQSTEMFQADRLDSDLADILYTSGTTGVPKGVASPHGNIATEDYGGFMVGETFGHAIPLATFAGTHVMMVYPVANQWTNVVLPKFDPERLCAVSAEQKVSVTYLVPAMAKLILDSGAFSRHDLTALKVILFGASPMPPDTLAKLHDAVPHASLINLYGLTEGGAAGTAMVYDPSRPTSVGQPRREARIRIVSEEEHDCEADEVGEIWIGPPQKLKRHYFRDPEATSRIFMGDWVRTGDLGYLDRDGYLYVVDRIKDIIIRGGYNISTIEVESIIDSHPEVKEAAVVGIAHDVLGEDVAAVVVLREGSSLSPQDLQEFCRERLADYKTPRKFEFVDALPRNALGKVLKRELRARFSGAG